MDSNIVIEPGVLTCSNKCGYSHRYDDIVAIRQPDGSLRIWEERTCPSCLAPLNGKHLRIKPSTHECGPICWYAVSNICACVCGGVNHARTR